MATTDHPVSARTPTPARAFVTVFLGVFLIVFVGSGLLTLVLPDRYLSVARVRVPSADTEVFRSEATLTAVAHQLQLNQLFARRYSETEPLDDERTRTILRRSMEVRRIRGTELAEVRVYSYGPDEAARLANAIAQSGIANALKSSSPSASNAPAIVESAVPSAKPARPNKPLNLVVGALVGAFLGVMAGGVGARLTTLRRPPENTKPV